MHSFRHLLLHAAIAFAVPLEGGRAGPSVTIQNGTVIGSTSGGVDSFKGIPFAQPPVGDLRLKPPQPINASFGTLTATGTPKSCPQFGLGTDFSSLADIPTSVLGLLADSPFGQTVSDAGEDCLTINVQRPSNATSSSKLPVLFWIFGGGFEFGSTQSYDGTSIIQRSVSMGQDVIYVAVNYRVGGFGFLAGSQLAEEGSTNLGLRDQRLGLEWVAENIAAFGGDPTKVTLWGESAGSISTFDHTVINGGDNEYKGQPLFRGAIMDSGSVIPADNVTAPQAQNIFNTVAQNAGCSGSADVLACLRGKDYTTFLNAANSVPGILSYRSLDLSYLPRPDPGDNFYSQSPELSVESGAFAKVPIIIGDQEDEGTLFSLFQSNISTNAQLITYLSTIFPSDPSAVADVTGLVANYPDDLGPAGSPFNTSYLNEVYPQFKRLAAVFGDITFTLSRRIYLQNVASKLPAAYSYLSSYLYGTPILGTFHSSDILYAYGDLTSLPVPTQSIQTYYINFVNSLNPNGAGTPAAPLIEWPQWSTGSPQLLNFLAASNQLIPDTFRANASQYLASKISAFRV
ncbi:MAG: hypothetical protein M1822_003673 [Bathelium mastoideum]|nr:MAG: hypothetical protein M1822_003673 [Bathelium mastoideum]